MFNIHTDKVTYYGYRKVRIASPLRSTLTTEFKALRAQLCLLAGNKMQDNHECYVVGGIAIMFSDCMVYIGPESSIRQENQS